MFCNMKYIFQVASIKMPKNMLSYLKKIASRKTSVQINYSWTTDINYLFLTIKLIKRLLCKGDAKLLKKLFASRILSQCCRFKCLSYLKGSHWHSVTELTLALSKRLIFFNRNREAHLTTITQRLHSTNSQSMKKVRN